MPLWRRWPHSLRCTQSRRHRRAALTRYANCHRFAARVCHTQLADLQWQWVNLSLSLLVSLALLYSPLCNQLYCKSLTGPVASQSNWTASFSMIDWLCGCRVKRDAYVVRGAVMERGEGRGECLKINDWMPDMCIIIIYGINWLRCYRSRLTGLSSSLPLDIYMNIFILFIAVYLMSLLVSVWGAAR